MVKFETKFDESITKAINVSQMKKIWWVYLFFSLLFILLGVVMLDEDFYMAIFYIIFGVAFTPFCIWLTFVIQKKLNKSMSVMSSDTKETYEFDENEINIKTEKGTDFIGTTKAKYNYIYKVVETKNEYLIYISKIQAHVVKKEFLVEGTLEELNNYFKMNLKENFKNL